MPQSVRAPPRIKCRHLRDQQSCAFKTHTNLVLPMVIVGQTVLRHFSSPDLSDRQQLTGITNLPATIKLPGTYLSTPD